MTTTTAEYLSEGLIFYGVTIAWALALGAFAADLAFASTTTRTRQLVGSGGPDVMVEQQPAASRWWGMAMGTFVIGTVMLGAGVVLRGIAAGRVPWANMYEFSITGSFLVAVAFLVFMRRYDLRSFAVWITGVLLLTVGLAVTVLHIPPAPLVPALDSPWLVIHVAAAFISASFFTIGMVATGLYLVRDVAQRRGHSSGRLVGQLPDTGTLDRIAYRVTAFGFPIWTFAVIAGAIWAEFAWGRFWGWDPKETWSLITWIGYAAYLHARTTAGWRGRRAAIINLVAYSTLIFNFFGVNIVFVGLHSYGGV